MGYRSWRGTGVERRRSHPPSGAPSVLTICDDDGETARQFGRAGDGVVRLVAGVGYHQQPGKRAGEVPTLRADATALPFGDNSFDAVVVLDTLEHIVDELAVIAEIARVLRPDGRVVVRVPQSAPQAWLDSLNLYRYVRDLTRRGKRPRETAGIGWHRHYASAEVVALLEHGGFATTAVRGSGTGLSEIVNLLLLLRFRWLVSDWTGYAGARRWAELLTNLDRRIVMPKWGFWVTIAARRLPDDNGDRTRANGGSADQG